MNDIYLRLPDSLLQRLEARVRREGVSLERFVTAVLAEKVSAPAGEDEVAARAARGNRRAFDEALERVPDVEPEARDRF